MINTKLLQSAINNYGDLEQTIEQAQKQQVIGAKQDYLELDRIDQTLPGNSDMSQGTKDGKTGIMKKIQSIKPSDNTFMSQVGEYMKNIHKMSNANDSSVIDIINSAVSGVAPLMIEDGKKVFDFGGKNKISKNQISQMMDSIVAPAMRQHNDLINSAANIAKQVTGGIVPESKIDQAVETIMNTPFNAQDTDPMGIIDGKKSFAVDSLGGKPSMRDYFKNSKEFNTAFDALKEGASDMFDEMLKPYLKDVYFSPVMQEKVAEQTEKPTPVDVNFSDLQSVENEISRLQGLSQQERYDTDYSEGSVEGTVTERIAKLQMQKEALSKGKSDLDKTPEWKKIG